MELVRRAREQGLSVTNYLRSLLRWPLEHQGSRKDLAAEEVTDESRDGTMPRGLHFNTDYPEARESERHDMVLIRSEDR